MTFGGDINSVGRYGGDINLVAWKMTFGRGYLMIGPNIPENIHTNSSPTTKQIMSPARMLVC